MNRKSNMRNLLYKDVKECNLKLILIVGLIFIMVSGYTSYALFTWTEASSNAITLSSGISRTSFSYTGDIQTYTVPKTGYYKLEVWGAQGGYSLNQNVISTAGGYGGYSNGIIKLTKNTVLYVVVGGKGTNGTNGSNASGGYNGGGSGTWDNADDEASGGGGGATHIATSTGLLSTLSSSTSNILIVAGGGGGASWTYSAGSGGGMYGGYTSYTSSSYATQTTGNAFGQGQDASGTGDSNGVGGGGGGYYGGYANDVEEKSSGTGGSGYIANYRLKNKFMYCYNCTTSDDDSTKTYTTTNTSEVPISKQAKEGNGAAIITYLGSTVQMTSTLYDELKSQVNTNVTPNFQYINNYNTDGINTNDSGVFLYNGTDDNAGDKNIYYYRGNVTNNNVLFGGYCWKIIRTTSTGGVKMIYNGEPNLTYDKDMAPIEQTDYENLSNDLFTFDSTNKVWTMVNMTNSDNEDFYDYAVESEISFTIDNPNNKNYYLDYNFSFEEDYIYDVEYSIDIYIDDNFIESISTINSSVISLGKITSSNVIKIYYYFNNSSEEIVNDNFTFSIKTYPDDATVSEFSCNNTGEASQLFFESRFNSSYESPADVGYMYGTKYTYSRKVMKPVFNHSTSSKTVLSSKSSMSSTTYYYYDDASYTNPVTIAWSSGYASVVGKWTCFSTTTSTCTTPYYIAGATSNYAYYNSEGKSSIVMADDVTYSSSTYTLSSPTIVDLKDYYENYSNYKSKYFCSDLTSTSCSSVYYSTFTSSTNITIMVTFTSGETYDNTALLDIVYGNSVTYSNGIYTLNNTITSKPANWSSDRTTLANGKHYTCFTTNATCETVYYIYSFGDSSNAYYLTFTDGDTLETAKTKMFTNTNNSTIKTAIDNWYSTNLSSYSSYLENTIFCNDRSFATGTLGGALAGESVNSTDYYSYFAIYERMYKTYSPSLTCTNQNDRFSLSVANGGTNNYGNNALTYPIGLITVDEVNLAGGRIYQKNNNFYLYSDEYYWSLSPFSWNTNSFYGLVLYANGALTDTGTNIMNGVRGVISLKFGTTITGGDGSYTNPYTIG